MASGLARSTILCTRSERTYNSSSAEVGAYVVRQPVRHSSWQQHRRQTVRRRCLKAARQEQGAAERDAPALLRVHQPKGHLNNALPKAKRRPPADLSGEVGVVAEAPEEQSVLAPADDQYAAAASAARRGPYQLLDAAATGSASLAAVAGEPDQGGTASPGQHAASGTVLGAIALITGEIPDSENITLQRCMVIMWQETVHCCTCCLRV